MVVSISADPQDHVADLEPSFKVTAWPHSGRTTAHTMAQGKIKIQNLKCGFYWVSIAFVFHHRVKNQILSRHKSGTVCNQILFSPICPWRTNPKSSSWSSEPGTVPVSEWEFRTRNEWAKYLGSDPAWPEASSGTSLWLHLLDCKKESMTPLPPFAVRHLRNENTASQVQHRAYSKSSVTVSCCCCDFSLLL